MVWYSILYCLEYDTKTSTKHITSIQADGTTAPTTGFRGSTDCYLDFISIPRLVITATVIVIKLKNCFPVARWMAPSLPLIASVEQSLVGLPLPPPINRSFVSFCVSFISSHLLVSQLRWFPSRWVSALTTTTARTLPTESLLVTNSCLVEHPSCLIVPYREHIFGQNNPNSSSQLVSLLIIRTFDIRRIPISCKLPFFYWF